MSEPSYAEPAGFLGQVLEEFGLPWTSIAVFSGLVLSGFGLSRYFSTAAWMITTVVAFTVVFLFRRQVSGRFALVALLSIATIAVLLGVGFVVAESQATTIKAYLLTHQTLSTVYIGLSIMMPIATMMLSYRRQETVFGGPFPKTVRDAIRRNLVELPFFKTDQRYEFAILSVTPTDLWVREVLSYTIINRTRSGQDYVIGFTPLRKKFEIISATIGRQKIPVDDPDFRSEVGLRVPQKFGPGERKSAEIVSKVKYQRTDSEVVTSYIPTESFELVITNAFTRDVRIVVETLMPNKVIPEVNGDDTAYRSQGGTLPYQGFKISWMPRDEESQYLEGEKMVNESQPADTIRAEEVPGLVRAVLSDEETEKEEQRLAEWRKSVVKDSEVLGPLANVCPKPE